MTKSSCIKHTDLLTWVLRCYYSRKRQKHVNIFCRTGEKTKTLVRLNHLSGCWTWHLQSISMFCNLFIHFSWKKHCSRQFLKMLLLIMALNSFLASCTSSVLNNIFYFNSLAHLEGWASEKNIQWEIKAILLNYKTKKFKLEFYTGNWFLPQFFHQNSSSFILMLL